MTHAQPRLPHPAPDDRFSRDALRAADRPHMPNPPAGEVAYAVSSLWRDATGRSYRR